MEATLKFHCGNVLGDPSVRHPEYQAGSVRLVLEAAHTGAPPAEDQEVLEAILGAVAQAVYVKLAPQLKQVMKPIASRKVNFCRDRYEHTYGNSVYSLSITLQYQASNALNASDHGLSVLDEAFGAALLHKKLKLAVQDHALV